MNQDEVNLRSAIPADLPGLVALIRDDSLGMTRESEDISDYLKAFEEILDDSSQVLLVAVLNGILVGTLQISFLRHLSRRGALRAQLESVRVSVSFQGKGIGRQMIAHAIEIARSRGCQIVQLTSDKTRTDAIEFYQSIGFDCSHEGLKLLLGSKGSGPLNGFSHIRHRT